LDNIEFIIGIKGEKMTNLSGLLVLNWYKLLNSKGHYHYNEAIKKDLN